MTLTSLVSPSSVSLTVSPRSREGVGAPWGSVVTGVDLDRESEEVGYRLKSSTTDILVLIGTTGRKN